MSQDHTSPQLPDGGAAAGGGVSIGSMSGGSIATGSHGRAFSVNATDATPDARHQELLAAVRELLAELPQQGARAVEDAALHSELVDLEAEITSSGRAESGRLTRVLGSVRRWLGSQAAAAGAVASATAVVQGIAQLLG
ncbi:hypothetical protein [Streptomyces chartreusis]|uniref:hypothetical protein n=1 Tax=Streptomyces chartreusis TaxID=1969 RepID=UPI002E17291A